MPTETLWISPTDFVTGDPSLQIRYPWTQHPAIEITTTSPGDFNWVELGLRLPPCIEIKAVRVCYQLSHSRSFISQVRLAEMQMPNQAIVQHDDATDLLSTAPACYVSRVGRYRPDGAVTLNLRLHFADLADKITLGAVGVDLEDFSSQPSGVVDIQKFGARIDGKADDAPAIQAAIAALPPHGGMVIVPAGETGECLIARTITINKIGVRFVGIGSGRYATRPRLVWQGTEARKTGRGAIAKDSDLLTAETPMFAPEDVGKSLVLTGAGHQAQPLCSTIVAVLAPTQCQLADRARTAAVHADFWYSTGGGTMIKVANGSHGIAIENLAFDANSLADACLHVEAIAGSSTHDAYLSRLHFENYRKHALVLGVATETPGHNGQMRVVTANHLVFHGGLTGASGVLLNAQNAEFVNFYSPYFDPGIGHEHKHHINQVDGGLQAFGLASTRATDCAIVSRGQLGVYGWRAEDRLLVRQPVAEAPPSSFINVHQRNTGVNDARDKVFDLNHVNAPQTFQSVRVQGSIYVGPTNQRYLNAQGVKFELPGAGYLLGGPLKNQRGIAHDTDAGSWLLQGRSPSIDFRLSQERTGDPATPAGTITGVKGISGGETKSHNLRGSEQISDAATFADVTFAEAEADNHYHVVATVNEISGTVPTAARTIDVSQKTNTGFRLNIAAAPGNGSSIVLAWILIR